MSTASTFGELVAIARRRMKLGQKALAQAVGVHPITVSNWERGEKEPDAKKKQEVARELLNGQPVNDQITAALEQFALGSPIQRFVVSESYDNDRYFQLPQALRVAATELEIELLRAGATDAEVSFVHATLQGTETLMMFLPSRRSTADTISEDFKSLMRHVSDFVTQRIEARREAVNRMRAEGLESPNVAAPKTGAARVNPEEKAG